MAEEKKERSVDEVGKMIMDVLVMLLEDQTGESLEYQFIGTKDETA